MSDFQELLYRYTVLLDSFEVVSDERDELGDTVIRLRAMLIMAGVDPDSDVIPRSEGE